MKTNPRSGPKKDEVGADEWDFNSIPKGEVEACFIYEYARELTKRSPRLLDLRAWAKAGSSAPKRSSNGKKAYSEFGKLMLACFPYMVLKFDDWFPNTSWQKLDQNVRSRLVEDLNYRLHDCFKSLPYHKLSIHTLRHLEAVNVRSIEIFRCFHDIGKADLSQTEYGFFAINWNYPDPEIQRVFAKWLLEQRKEREKRGLSKIKHKPKGRGGFRDRLNWLGALHVKEHYQKKQLVDHADHYLKVATPYGHLPDLYEAAKKALQLLSTVSDFWLGRS
jgi:hypothetical protein